MSKKKGQILWDLQRQSHGKQLILLELSGANSLKNDLTVKKLILWEFVGKFESKAIVFALLLRMF